MVKNKHFVRHPHPSLRRQTVSTCLIADKDVSNLSSYASMIDKRAIAVRNAIQISVCDTKSEQINNNLIKGNKVIIDRLSIQLSRYIYL